MTRLGLTLLSLVDNVNSFQVVSELYLNGGENETLYFQLTDLTQGLRYMPTAMATVQVTFRNLDCNKLISRAATMAFPLDDRSIWSIPIFAADSIPPDSISAVLTDGLLVKNLHLDGSLRFIGADDQDLYC